MKGCYRRPPNIHQYSDGEANGYRVNRYAQQRHTQSVGPVEYCWCQIEQVEKCAKRETHYKIITSEYRACTVPFLGFMFLCHDLVKHGTLAKSSRDWYGCSFIYPRTEAYLGSNFNSTKHPPPPYAGLAIQFPEKDQIKKGPRWQASVPPHLQRLLSS